jgi:hypothetical protein
MDLSERAGDVVRAFRLGEDAQANTSLVALIDALASALALPPLAQHNAQILPALQQILDAQMRGDTLWIADLIAYELLPIFASTRAV